MGESANGKSLHFQGIAALSQKPTLGLMAGVATRPEAEC